MTTPAKPAMMPSTQYAEFSAKVAAQTASYHSPKSSARLTRGESRAAVSNRHRDTNGTADHLAHWRDEYRVGQCRQPVPTRPRHDSNAVLRLSGFAAKRVLTTVFRHVACGSSAPDV